MRILLLEDNEDHAVLVGQALAGHSVVHATRLQDALILTDVSKIDLVLTDLTLPDAKGIDAVRRLRKAAPDVPVVVLTATADERVVQSALEHGALDYLVKDELLCDGKVAGSLLQRTMRHALLRHEGLRENNRLVVDLQENKSLLERKNDRLRALCDTAQRFVENVSHDFRTPLTVIKEFSSLIREGVVGETNAEQQRMLHIVEDRADDLNTMVDDLLDVSKLEAGLLNMWRRKASLPEIVAHIIPGLERKAEVKGVQLVVDVDAHLPAIFCDEEKVGRVIVNLVVNAIKFCKKGGRVELWARADAEQSEVTVGITDDGPGIPPDKLKMIFERFKQASTSASQDIKGFGLGLSIARELAELNLGHLSVASEVDKGSTFSFTIPFADVEEIFVRYVKRVRGLEGAGSVCSALSIATTETATARDVDDLDAFLSHSVRRNDLALRLDDGRWLILLLVPPIEAKEFVGRTQVALVELNRNMPLGALPEIQFTHEGVLLLTDSLRDLKQCIAPMLAGREACHV